MHDLSRLHGAAEIEQSDDSLVQCDEKYICLNKKIMGHQIYSEITG